MEENSSNMIGKTHWGPLMSVDNKLVKLLSSFQQGFCAIDSNTLECEIINILNYSLKYRHLAMQMNFQCTEIFESETHSIFFLWSDVNKWLYFLNFTT